jgi:hypothetical protein
MLKIQEKKSPLGVRGINWSLVRIVRVLMGGFVIFEAVRTGQYLFGIIGLLVFIQGLMNFGCGCEIPRKRN